MILHYLLVTIIFTHGLHHLMGYAKAFEYTDSKHLEAHISRPIGILWMMGCLFFIAAGLLFILYNEYWQIAALVAIISSQTVINIGGKKDSYGTLVNLLILTAIIRARFTGLFNT